MYKGFFHGASVAFAYIAVGLAFNFIYRLLQISWPSMYSPSVLAFGGIASFILIAVLYYNFARDNISKCFSSLLVFIVINFIIAVVSNFYSQSTDLLNTPNFFVSYNSVVIIFMRIPLLFPDKADTSLLYLFILLFSAITFGIAGAAINRITCFVKRKFRRLRLPTIIR